MPNLKHILLLAPFLALSSAQTPATCNAPIPSWAIDDVKISFRNPTEANFTLTDTVANTKEDVYCKLEFATFCEIKGTPANKDLYIHLQTRNEDVWFNVTVPWSCEGRPGQVTGAGERLLECGDDWYKCQAGKIEVVGGFVGW